MPKIQWNNFTFFCSFGRCEEFYALIILSLYEIPLHTLDICTFSRGDAVDYELEDPTPIENLRRIFYTNSC